jgi:hypothetical protein
MTPVVPEGKTNGTAGIVLLQRTFDVRQSLE